MRLTHRHQNHEQRFVKGLKSESRASQKEVFEHYSPKMLSICKSYINDFHYAEDCMINGFRKVFQHIQRFESKGSFEGWIRRIMVNECLSFLRTNQTLIYLDDNRFSDLDETDDWEENEFDFDVHAVLDQLENPYRIVFNLYVLENYSHQDIAEQLNISVSSSKTQLHRAKAKLKEIVLILKKLNYEKE